MSTIADALVSLGVSGYSLIGEPTTEEEFKAAFTGTTDKTWAEIKAEKECIDGLASLQAEWDKNNADYVKKRRAAYPSLQEQFDMQYFDSVNGTTTWKDAIAKVKSDNPKPS